MGGWAWGMVLEELVPTFPSCHPLHAQVALSEDSSLSASPQVQTLLRRCWLAQNQGRRERRYGLRVEVGVYDGVFLMSLQTSWVEATLAPNHRVPAIPELGMTADFGQVTLPFGISLTSVSSTQRFGA